MIAKTIYDFLERFKIFYPNEMKRYQVENSGFSATADLKSGQCVFFVSPW
jgi:hypothetical protein